MWAFTFYYRDKLILCTERKNKPYDLDMVLCGDIS